MKDPLTLLCVALIVIVLGWVERDKWWPQKVEVAAAPAPVHHLAPEGTFYVVSIFRPAPRTGSPVSCRGRRFIS